MDETVITEHMFSGNAVNDSTPGITSIRIPVLRAYGIEANRKSLEALFHYSHQQGLCGRILKIEEIFEPSSLALAEPDI